MKKLELRHDIFAEKIYDRLSPFTLERKNTDASLMRKWQDYNKGVGPLLTDKELEHILTYQPDFADTSDGIDFIQLSQTKILQDQRKRLLRRWFIIILIAALIIASLFALIKFFENQVIENELEKGNTAIKAQRAMIETLHLEVEEFTQQKQALLTQKDSLEKEKARLTDENSQLQINLLQKDYDNRISVAEQFINSDQIAKAGLMINEAEGFRKQLNQLLPTVLSEDKITHLKSQQRDRQEKLGDCDKYRDSIFSLLRKTQFDSAIARAREANIKCSVINETLYLDLYKHAVTRAVDHFIQSGEEQSGQNSIRLFEAAKKRIPLELKRYFQSTIQYIDEKILDINPNYKNLGLN